MLFYKMISEFSIWSVTSSFQKNPVYVKAHFHQKIIRLAPVAPETNHYVNAADLEVRLGNEVNQAFHPSGVDKLVPASAGD